MLEPYLMGTVATLYGVGAAGTALLQARQVLRRGSSCEVSARFFATYAGGYAVSGCIGPQDDGYKPTELLSAPAAQD
jgi:hypothetical protein